MFLLYSVHIYSSPIQLVATVLFLALQPIEYLKSSGDHADRYQYTLDELETRKSIHGPVDRCINKRDAFVLTAINLE